MQRLSVTYGLHWVCPRQHFRIMENTDSCTFRKWWPILSLVLQQELEGAHSHGALWSFPHVCFLDSCHHSHCMAPDNGVLSHSCQCLSFLSAQVLAVLYFFNGLTAKLKT